MRVADRISEVLQAEFSPRELEVIDESHLHAGHAGAPAGGQSHFQVRMRSEALSGLSRVAQQRKVYAALKVEMSGPIHALSLDVGP